MGTSSELLKLILHTFQVLIKRFYYGDKRVPIFFNFVSQLLFFCIFVLIWGSNQLRLCLPTLCSSSQIPLNKMLFSMFSVARRTLIFWVHRPYRSIYKKLRAKRAATSRGSGGRSEAPRKFLRIKHFQSHFEIT